MITHAHETEADSKNHCFVRSKLLLLLNTIIIILYGRLSVWKREKKKKKNQIPFEIIAGRLTALRYIDGGS